jgi:hypothetical protein
MLAAATHSITAGASGEDAAGPPPLPAALPSSAAAALGTSMSPRLPPARCFKLPMPEGLALPGVEVANRGSRSPAALSRRLAGLPPPVIRWLPADTGRLDRPRGLGRPTGDSWARMRPTARPTGALIQLLASTTAVIRRARGKYRRDQLSSALRSSEKYDCLAHTARRISMLLCLLPFPGPSDTRWSEPQHGAAIFAARTRSL